MSTALISLLMIALAIVALIAITTSRPRGQQLTALANVFGSYTYEGHKTYKADEVIATTWLHAKKGSDSEHIAIGDQTDEPVGIITDQADAIADVVNVELPGTTHSTMRGVASGAIALGEHIYTDDNGKVQGVPSVAGTYWRFGRALEAVTTDGDVVDFEPYTPVRVVVLAELTAPDTADGSDAGTTQTLANALKADLATIETALATPGELMLLNS